MPQLEHDGAILAYDDTGEADLPPVVLLPGLSGARTTWRPVADGLRGRFRVIAVDQRGHGESSHVPGTYTLEHYGADTVALCDHVLDRPAVLVGHSLGGVIAHHVALERPALVRGVFLEDPPLYFGVRDEAEASPFPALFALMRDAFRERHAKGAGLDVWVDGVRRMPAMNGAGTMGDVLGEEGSLASAQAFFSLDPEIFTPAVEGTALAAARPGAPLPCPVTVLRADPSVGPAFTADNEARFLATNPHATVTLVEGASHLIHDEQPARFLDELLRFVDSLPAGE